MDCLNFEKMVKAREFEVFCFYTFSFPFLLSFFLLFLLLVSLLISNFDFLMNDDYCIL